MKYSLSSLILFLCLTFSSCIEFEREKLSYIHDVDKDELRVTLTYEGIFGNLDKGEYTQKNRDDVATHESLNQLQIDQLESVLREKRAFFFSNWIAEYSKPSVEKMLKSIIKGNKHGKGNPELPTGATGHRTNYLWDEVFTRESLANIIQHFVRLDGKKKDPIKTKTLFFPRYHQMDVVRKIIDDASRKGVGQTYLIQHSAGSGKSNSITWAAYQLIETYPKSENTPGNRGLEQPLLLR